jgi:hypothetical protein
MVFVPSVQKIRLSHNSNGTECPVAPVEPGKPLQDSTVSGAEQLFGPQLRFSNGFNGPEKNEDWGYNNIYQPVNTPLFYSIFSL